MAKLEDSEERVTASVAGSDDQRFDRIFRPTSLDEFVGQSRHKDNLRVFIEAAKRRREPLDHILLCGPPGLGKTTLAHIRALEMGVNVHVTSGPISARSCRERPSSPVSFSGRFFSRR